MRAGVIASALHIPPPPELIFDGVLDANDGATWSQSITLTHTGTVVMMVVWQSGGGDDLRGFTIDGQPPTWHIGAGWGQPGSGFNGIGLLSATPSAPTIDVVVTESNARMNLVVGVWSSPVPLAYRTGGLSARTSAALHEVSIAAESGDLIVAGVSLSGFGPPSMSGAQHYSTVYLGLASATQGPITATTPAPVIGRVGAGAFYPL